MQSRVLSRGASLNRLSSPAALQPITTLRAAPLPARTAQRQQQQQQQQQSWQQPRLVCRAQQQEGSAPAAAPAAAPAPPSPLLELNQENFYKYLEDNEDKLTVRVCGRRGHARVRACTQLSGREGVLRAPLALPRTPAQGLDGCAGWGS